MTWRRFNVSVTGSVEDRAFKVGDKSVKLSEVRRISLKKEGAVVLSSANTLKEHEQKLAFDMDTPSPDRLKASAPKSMARVDDGTNKKIARRDFGRRRLVMERALASGSGGDWRWSARRP